MTKKYLDVIDPIHEFIRIFEPELKIIDTPIFQRLRRIRQLAGAHLTYPGAQHTRFEHSLGAMHLAGQAGNVLYDKGLLDLDDIPNIRLGALLHDIGHGPFSHLFEEVLQKKKISHEQIGKQLVLKTEIGDLISKAGFDKKFLSLLAFGNSKFPFMNEIISGTLSADVMDYLPRDGYFTGAEHAKIDSKRLIQSLDVYQKKLSLDKSALYSFESMMISRYQMFKAVYFHKTVRSAEVMLLESMNLADDELGLTSFSLDEYIKLTDEFVISKLLELSSRSSKLRKAKKLATDYQERRLLKCVYEKIISRTGRHIKIKTSAIRKEISKISGVDESEIFVDSLVTSSIPMTPSKRESQSIMLTTKRGSNTVEAYELPISKIPLVSAISAFMGILRVYTPQKNRKKVEIAAQRILGKRKT
ncbi:MAG: deoxyguanosinetriphosphate triphosphohydrolase [Marine Group I thaumarchaeote]|nr:MAG: deoxyguanosinetriphosphate triphosphohydrolase [Marine Group I thaumarchaeote]